MVKTAVGRCHCGVKRERFSATAGQFQFVLSPLGLSSEELAFHKGLILKKVLKWVTSFNTLNLARGIFQMVDRQVWGEAALK